MVKNFITGSFIMLIAILQFVLMMIFLAVMAAIVWESTLMLDERKKNYRAGTHDYYGNRIKPFDKSDIKYRDGDNT
jgi:hypothetical protein